MATPTTSDQFLQSVPAVATATNPIPTSTGQQQGPAVVASGKSASTDMYNNVIPTYNQAMYDSTQQANIAAQKKLDAANNPPAQTLQQFAAANGVDPSRVTGSPGSWTVNTDTGGDLANQLKTALATPAIRIGEKGYGASLDPSLYNLPTGTKIGDNGIVVDASGNPMGDASTYLKPPTPTATDTNAALLAQNADILATQKTFSDTVTQIQNGTFPLSPDQTNQLANLQAQWNTLIQNQQIANTNYVGQMGNLASSLGWSQYEPAEAAGMVANAVNVGGQKIQELNTQMSTALSAMHKGFMDSDLAAVKDSYDAYTAAQQKITDNIQKMNDNTAAALKTQQDQQKEDSSNLLAQTQNQLMSPDLDSTQKQALLDQAMASGTLTGADKQLLNKFQVDNQATYTKDVNDFLATQNLTRNPVTGAIVPILPKPKAVSSTGGIASSGTTGTSVGGSGSNGGAVGTTGSSIIDATAAGYATNEVPGTGGLTQAAIDQDALATALGQPLPVPLGLSSTGTGGQKRTAINNRMAEINAGGNVAANKSTLTALSASLKKQTDYSNATERSLTSAEQGLQQVLDTFKSKGINNYSLTIGNIIANAAKYQLNPDDIAAFKAGMAEVANEYSQVFSRGGQQSESTRAQAKDILDGNVSMSALQKITDELQAQGHIVLSNTKDQISSIQKQINDIVTPGGSQVSDQIKYDIANAIKDTFHYQNREQLINDIANSHGISVGEAGAYVYSQWGDNLKR